MKLYPILSFILAVFFTVTCLQIKMIMKSNVILRILTRFSEATFLADAQRKSFARNLIL
jgi:hypothetical protein